MRNNVNILMALVSVLGVLTLIPNVAWTDPSIQSIFQCPAISNSATPKELAEQLKPQVKEYYNRLPRNATYADVSKIFSCYIPDGTTFKKAELVLRDAGFTVYPGPWSSNAANGASVRAEIDPYDQGFIWRVELVVFLAPKSPEEYDYISSLSAFFDFSSL